ncbi:MAG TPA: VOC family protein [Solirubrobacteraceae bacterium]|nr:VOC family protein [Solirubrobacteraceae bacterium]
MKPRIHVITLGVADLERALRFYRDGLGFRSEGITGTQFPGDDENPAGDVVMFTLEDGLVFALYPRSELAKDAGVGPEAVAGSGFSIGHLVESREEVDRILDLAGRAGGQVLGPAHERPWGIYSGYFSDPDGHLWEIVYFPPMANPGGSAP